MISYIPYAIFLALSHYIETSSLNSGFNFRVSFMSWKQTEKTTKIYMCIISGPQGLRNNIQVVYKDNNIIQGPQTSELDLSKLETKSFFFESTKFTDKEMKALYAKSWGRDAKKVASSIISGSELKDVKVNPNVAKGKLQNGISEDVTVSQFDLGDLCGYSDDEHSFGVVLGLQKKLDLGEKIYYVYGMLSKGGGIQSHFGDVKETQIRTMAKFTVELGKELKDVEIPKIGEVRGGKVDENKNVVVIAVASTLAVAMILLCVFVIYRTRKASKAKKRKWMSKSKSK